MGWIRFNRPEKMNAIGALTRKQLAESVRQAERDDAIRVLVLSVVARAFSPGAEVTEMVQGQGGARGPGSAGPGASRGEFPPQTGMRTPEDVGNVLRGEYMPMLMRLRTMPKPVIAAMNGPAVGIGASFAPACDIPIATPEADILEAVVHIRLAPHRRLRLLPPPPG